MQQEPAKKDAASTAVRKPEQCKAVNEFRFHLLGSVLHSQARLSAAAVAASVLAAAILLVWVSETAANPLIGFCAALHIVVGIFGITTWSGALRIKALMEAAPEISVVLDNKDKDDGDKPKKE